MISDHRLSKVQFHSTPERAGKDRLAELYLRVNIDREVCVVYILIMIYFAFILHRFSLIPLLLISVSCHVNFRFFRLGKKKGPDFVITGIGLLEVINNAHSE